MTGPEHVTRDAPRSAGPVVHVDGDDLRERRSQNDAVTVLTGYVVLLFAIPSRLTIGSLGGFGTPAALVGVSTAILWAVIALMGTRSAARLVHPVRRAGMILALTMVASYVGNAMRPSVAQEWGAALLPMATALSWFAVFFFTADLVPSMTRLQTLVRRLAVAGGIEGALAVLQFVTSNPLTQYLDIPGLSANAALTAIGDRNGLNRPSGTAIHAIEFGVSVVALLPFALHSALHRMDLGVVRRWWPVAVIAVGALLSMSRSSIVCAVVVFAVLLPTWPRIRRWTVATLAVAGTVAVGFAVPGLFSSISGLFFGIEQDTSARSRTDSYGIAFEFIDRSPVLGRGFGSFLPRYRIFDNAYLLFTVEVGLVGLAALLGFFVTAAVSSLVARRQLRPDDVGMRDLGAAIAASMSSITFGFALFDALSFPMYAGLVFLIAGLAGAYYRVVKAPASRPGAESALAS